MGVRFPPLPHVGAGRFDSVSLVRFQYTGNGWARSGLGADADVAIRPSWFENARGEHRVVKGEVLSTPDC